MPITNEYSQGGNTARQDFQKGYLYYDGSTVTSHPSNYMPGRTSTGWNHQYSYLFALAYERNGARNTVGDAIGLVETYDDYKRQKFDNGSYQDCWVMYDLSNHVGNPFATNEAYLLRTGFYEEYFLHPTTQEYNAGGWVDIYGCPSRDEEPWGDPGDAIQFFVVRAGGNTDHHHMYFDYSQSPGPDRIKFHSTYATDYVSQNPSGILSVQRGDSRTYTVSFRNTSQFVWYNNSASYPGNYVELKSCDASGATCESFLNYPYDGALGWLNVESPCTMQESSVAPGDVATFSFTGKIDANAPLGLKLVYFRVNHSIGGLMPGWSGMHFQVDVVDPPPPPEYHAKAMAEGDFDNDGKEDDMVCLYDYPGSECRIHTWLSNGTTFTYSGPTGWWYLPSGYPSENVRQFVSGDFDRDGFKDDLAALYDYGQLSDGRYRACWHLWLGTGDSLIYQTPQGWWLQDGYNANLVRDAASGDFNGNGYQDDIACMYNYGDGECAIHVWLSTGDSLAYQTPQGWWNVASGYESENVRFMLSGDVDNDGDDDLSTFYDYGYIPEVSKYRTRVHVWLSTTTSFTYQGGGGWWTVDGYNMDDVTQAVGGDFDNNGRHDLATFYDYGLVNGKYRTRIHVWLSTGTSYAYQGGGGWWSVDGYNANSVIHALSAPFTTDNYMDIVSAYDYSDGDTSRFHMFRSTATSFTYDGPAGWWYSYGYPLPKIAEGENLDGILPSLFTLNQNYPNPFNPVTVISYSLPTASDVRLDVFNILGQRVATLVNQKQEVGEHTITWDASRFSSGVYFYRIQTAEAVETKKMLLLK